MRRAPQPWRRVARLVLESHGAREAKRVGMATNQSLRRPAFKLVLHAGTPKTGTTAFQGALYRSARVLAEHGVWYAPPLLASGVPGHQFLVRLLLAGDCAGIAQAFERIVRELPERTRLVLLSAEGIYNHWWDFPPRSKRMLRRLAGAFDLELWVCFREPEAFALALYAQDLVNPPLRAHYGTDAGFEEVLESDAFARRLNYCGFLREAEQLVGVGNVRAFRYGPDIVQRFARALGVPRLADGVERANASLRNPGVDIVRIVNRYGLAGEEKRAAVDLVRRIDALLRDRAEPLSASPAARRRIAELSAAGWAATQDFIAACEP